MGRLVVVLLAGTTGCAQLAGLDETSEIEPASLTLDRLSIGANLVRVPQDLSALTASYLVEDGASPDGLARHAAELTAPNTWSSPVYTESTHVMFTVGDGYPRIWSLPNRHVTAVVGALEHPNPMPAPSGAMITVETALPTPVVATEQFELYTVGAWNRMPLAAPLVGATTLGPVTYPYASSLTLTGRPLEKLTVDDAPVLLRYDGNALTAFMDAAPFDQTGDHAISGALTPVVNDQTFDVAVDPSAPTTRLAAVQPAMTAFSMGWALRASPGAEVSVAAGPLLQHHAIAPTSPPQVTAVYGNPFVARGWSTTLELAATGARVYTDAANASVTLDAAIVQLVDPGAITPGATLDPPVGVPEVVSIDDVALTTDGMQIARPTFAVNVTFTTSTPDNTVYELTLFEHTLDMAGTGYTRRPVVSAAGVAPSFVLPPELFEPGKQYNLRANVIAGGYINIAEGDLTSRPLPFAYAFVDSAVFTVMP